MAQLPANPNTSVQGSYRQIATDGICQADTPNLAGAQVFEAEAQSDCGPDAQAGQTKEGGEAEAVATEQGLRELHELASTPSHDPVAEKVREPATDPEPLKVEALGASRPAGFRGCDQRWGGEMASYLGLSAGLNLFSSAVLFGLEKLSNLSPGAASVTGVAVDAIAGMITLTAFFTFIDRRESGGSLGLGSAIARSAAAMGALEPVNHTTRFAGQYSLGEYAQLRPGTASLTASLAATVLTTALLPVIRGMTRAAVQVPDDSRPSAGR